MRLFSLQQDRASVLADFAFYGLGVVFAATVTWARLPAGRGVQALGWAAAGSVAWTLAEYLLHRCVLHGLQPFKRWHALHHERPLALIATPTALTAPGFALLVVAPAWWLAPHWGAGAFVSGVLAGYLAYTATHHAVHQARGRGAWLRRHRHWHAQHHRAGSQACYGVSLPLWDHVFGSTLPVSAGPRQAAP
jgi:cyclopropane-fatty-acyl-phospholipid synthase